MRVYLTGGRGFVGRRLAARLARDGHDCAGSQAEADVTRPEALAEALAEARPDAVVHLAARSSVARSHRDPLAVYRVNYQGTLNLLEAVAVRAPEARVLVVGSGAVYGSAPPGGSPFAETAPLRPGSPYAWTKAAADRLAGSFAGERGLDVVRVRPFNHTGPGRPDHFVESSFARQLAEMERGAPPRLRVGNLEAVRDYLDVEDVVDAYLALLDPRVAPGVYNLASGRGRRIGELLETLLAHSPARPEVEVVPERWRPTESVVGDAGRLRQATDWAPRVPLDDTLSRLLDAWRRELRAA